jgi:hypothetical protein
VILTDHKKLAAFCDHYQGWNPPYQHRILYG